MEKANSRIAVSDRVFAATAALLIVVAGIGFGLYATQAPRTISVTTTLTTSSSRIGVVGGFLNGNVVAFEFYTPYSCNPPVGQLFPDQTTAQNATNVTPCEVGAPGTFPANAIPVWGLVPAFAGLSIFGVPSLGASQEGFPTYNNRTILTDCTGMGASHPCPDHPKLFYSPANVAIEQYMGINNGIMGLPEGVVPFPAHTHIVDIDAGQQNIPWNAIAVFVFDPNILPNPVTGQCIQIVPSSLANATGNCLTSISALQRAMATTNGAIADANANNPIWGAIGKPLVQVAIAGATDPSQYRNANSNIDVPFAVKDYNPYPPFTP